MTKINFITLYSLFITLFLAVSCKEEPQVVRHLEVHSKDFFTQNIKPIFDNRCVACHACYNSPCQLNLVSYEGVQRGASHDDPYDFPLLNSKPPTRLGVDAKNTDEWRQKGFFTVVQDKYDRSLIAKVIDIDRVKNYKDHEFKAEESRVCPDAQGGFNNPAYLKYHNMPYGLPKLSSKEIETIKTWVNIGAPGPDKRELQVITGEFKEKIQNDINAWEDVLNNTSFKHRLSARYFYEHTFLAHLYFEKTDTQFFRLIRAHNKKGPPVEIPTDRPYDDPKKAFFYRFQKVTETLVSKTHIVFPLSKERFEGYKKLFIEKKWMNGDEEFPKYGSIGANPFMTFKAIPRESRYRFFLENARYFIRAFMKGPVCRGQTALNVINDHFWVMFVDPQVDITANDDAYFNKYLDLMTPPAELEDKLKLVTKLRRNRWKANEVKMQRYAEKKISLNYDSIWNGFDGANKNALLTVYRHFDSSDILWGAKGTVPKTIWVMDYQIFEDIYYNLVAGYNLYGPILHQLNTRLYMDLSRISSEDMFLNFLPQEVRESERQTWSQEVKPTKNRLAAKFVSDVLGEGAQAEMEKKFPYQGSQVKTKAKFKTKKHKEEFLENLFSKRFDDKKFVKEIDIDSNLAELAGRQAPFVRFFPDVVFLRVKGSGDTHKAYSIVRNRFHYNVNMLFFEDQRQDPAKDTLDILPEYAASYPNFYLDVKESELEALKDELLKENMSEKEFLKVMKKYGVNRLAPNFWEVHDWFNEDYQKQSVIEGALFDLNRYVNF